MLSIITDLYAAPDPRYSTGFEVSTIVAAGCGCGSPGPLIIALSAFLPVLSGPTASCRYSGSSSANSVWIGDRSASMQQNVPTLDQSCVLGHNNARYRLCVEVGISPMKIPHKIAAW